MVQLGFHFFFKEKLYTVKNIHRLISSLKKNSASSPDATVPVIPTEDKTTIKTRRCKVDVVYEDTWKIIRRTLTVSLPDHLLVERDGQFRVPIEFMNGKLGKYETLAYASSPVLSGMVTEIENLVAEILEIDSRERAEMFPPDEFAPGKYGGKAP